MEAKIRITKKQEKELLKVLKNELVSLAGACRTLRKIADRDTFIHAGIDESVVDVVMDCVLHCDLVKIATNAIEKVGTTFARECTIVQKHYSDKSKCFNKTDEIKPLKGLMYKDFGFYKPVKREDCVSLGFIKNINQTKTYYRESIYVERVTFSPLLILSCLVAYINAGSPALRETAQNKARRAKVAAAKKKEQATA